MLEDLGNIGDFLGGIGVVVTLLYLAYQIRQNTQSVRSAAVQAALADVATTLDGLVHDPELLRIFFDGQKDFASFSAQERRRFATFLVIVLRRYENLLFQTRSGVIETEQWAGLVEDMRRIVCQPGTQVWWEKGRQAFNAETRAFVDDLIASGPEAG